MEKLKGIFFAFVFVSQATTSSFAMITQFYDEPSVKEIITRIILSKETLITSTYLTLIIKLTFMCYKFDKHKIKFLNTFCCANFDLIKENKNNDLKEKEVIDNLQNEWEKYIEKTLKHKNLYNILDILHDLLSFGILLLTKANDGKLDINVINFIPIIFYGLGKLIFLTNPTILQVKKHIEENKEELKIFSNLYKKAIKENNISNAEIIKEQCHNTLEYNHFYDSKMYTVYILALILITGITSTYNCH